MLQVIRIILLALFLTGCSKKTTTTARVDSLYQKVLTEVQLPVKSEVILPKAGRSKIDLKVGKARVKLRIDSTEVIATIESDSQVVFRIDSSSASSRIKETTTIKTRNLQKWLFGVLVAFVGFAVGYILRRF